MTTDLFDAPVRPKKILEEPTDDRPVIIYEKSLGHLGVDEAMTPLAASGLVYSRSNRLVQVLFFDDAKTDDDIERETSSPVISDVSASHLWELLSRCAAWMKFDGRAKRMVGCDPPGQIVAAVHSRGHWDNISELRGISTVPILRKDGSVSTTPGYDHASGLFYAPNGPDPVIPGSPGREDAAEAAEKLLRPVSQFPWVASHHASAWLSTVLARVARPAFDGGVPMCVIDSNTPGTGKSKLVDASSVISTGLLAARSPYVGDDEELRKRITAHLMAGDQICLIDNVPGGRTVGWPSLDCALTAGVWSDRELGASRRVRLPMEAIFFVTGNNIGIGADAGRRTLRIRIQSLVANPELRTGFEYDPLIPRLRQERPFLLGYALTLVRAYLLAGSPDVGLTSIGSFEGWSSVVRASMVWAGLPDPALALANKEPGLDEEADAHITLMRDWHLLEDLSSAGGLTAANVLAQIQHRQLEGLAEAVQILCPTRDGSLPIPRRLGMVFRSMMDRVRMVDGVDMKLVRGQDRLHLACWSVVKCSQNSSYVINQVFSPQGMKDPQVGQHQGVRECHDKSRSIGGQMPCNSLLPFREPGCDDGPESRDSDEPPHGVGLEGRDSDEPPTPADTDKPDWDEDEDD